MRYSAALLDRFKKLLDLPDEPDLQHRGHKVTYEGRPDRWERVYLPLRMAWELRRKDLGGWTPGRHASASTNQPRRLWRVR